MLDKTNWQDITKKIILLGKNTGFNGIGVSDHKINLNKDKYLNWLKEKKHGSMGYLERHAKLKFNPENILRDTKSIISARLDYLPLNENLIELLNKKNKAYIARYALGRDYHKTFKQKLNKFAKSIGKLLGPNNYEFKYRVITDSAPSPEIEIAEKAGLGWRGKNTLLINKNNGSWFFLGEIYSNLPLITNTKKSINHCGSCSACIDICPTKAIEGPYQLNATKCISYWTIEHKGPIPKEFRRLIGNRVYGCDDCQIICPWNKFAKLSSENDFFVRHQLNNISLQACFKMSEDQFSNYFSGSAIKRIGFKKWISNIAIGLGNSDFCAITLELLKERANDESELIKEHVLWAIYEQESKK